MKDYDKGYVDGLARAHLIAARCAANWARVPAGEQKLRLDAEVSIELADAIAATIQEVADKLKAESNDPH